MSQINYNQKPPYAFIQWQGTDVCADVHCECGAAYHFDGEFFFSIICSECGRHWEVEPFVRLLPNEDNTHGHPIVLGDKESHEAR